MAGLTELKKQLSTYKATADLSDFIGALLSDILGSCKKE